MIIYCIYISFSTHTLTNWYFFFFVLKSIYTYRWRLKIADAILVDILQLTNWIIAGNSPKCNNMIYFIAFNLKSDCSNKTYYHFLFLTLYGNMFIASFFMKTIRLILCSLTKYFKRGNVLIWWRLKLLNMY